MKTSVLLTKLQLENKEFVTSGELRAYCKSMGLDYDTLIRYFGSRKYLVRIFRGVFYVKSVEESKLGRRKYNHLELVSKGLELKRVKNWYFGLHSALKLNNMTHEHFTIEEVVNDSLLRPRPMSIAGYKFRFVKLSPKLLGFGVKEKGIVRYSDPEKTILDFIYTWRYNGVPEDKIVLDVSEWSEDLSKEDFRKYARNYPKSVARIMDSVIA